MHQTPLAHMTEFKNRPGVQALKMALVWEKSFEEAVYPGYSRPIIQPDEWKLGRDRRYWNAKKIEFGQTDDDGSDVIRSWWWRFINGDNYSDRKVDRYAFLTMDDRVFHVQEFSIPRYIPRIGETYINVGRLPAPFFPKYLICPPNLSEET